MDTSAPTGKVGATATLDALVAGLSDTALSSSDKAMLEVHASMLDEGFEAFTEGHAAPVAAGKLAEGWRSNGLHVFYYRHPRSSLKFEMKGVPLAGSIVALLSDGETVKSLPVGGSAGGDTTAVRAAVKRVFSEPFVPCGSSSSSSSAPAPTTQPTPAALPAPAGPTSARPPVTGPDPLRDYGRGDLMPGSGGSNLMGPEVFRNWRGGDRGGASGQFFDPDGNLITPPPPGARYDPTHPLDPMLQHDPRSAHPDLEPPQVFDPLLVGKGRKGGGMGGPPGGGFGGFGGFGGGGAPPGMFM